MNFYSPLRSLRKINIVIIAVQAMISLMRDVKALFVTKMFHANLRKIGINMHSSARAIGEFTSSNCRASGRVSVGMYSIIAISDHNYEGIEKSSIEFGDNVYVGDQCNIRACGGRVSVGSDVLIANHVTIVTSNHGFGLGSEIIYQPWNKSPLGVTICDGCWIGANVVLLPGSHIEKGAIVAAGAVVNCRIPEYEIWGGVPARRISVRR